MRSLLVGLTVALLAASGSVRAQTTDVAIGIEALARRDVRGAEAAFARASEGANAAIRPAAWQWRAHVAWKIRGDTAAAVRYLDAGLREAKDSSTLLLEIARLSGARRRYREATRTAYEAMLRSQDGEGRGRAARTLVSLAADGVLAARGNSAADSVDVTLLTVVRDSMAARVARFPGRTQDALALIDAGAMLKDHVSIETGLRSYLMLVDSTAGRVTPSQGREPLWSREGGAPRIATDWRPPFEDLVRSTLHESALLLRRVQPPSQHDERWVIDLSAYVEFIRDLRASAESSYRDALNGRATRGDITRAIARHGRRFWGETLPVRGEAFSPAALRRALAQRYAAVISVEENGGIEELHFAHVLTSKVLSLGQTPASVVTLDGVVASGVDAWLLDAAGGRAGWVSGDTVYQRRTAFTETPFRAWLGLADPQSMPGELVRIYRDSIGDLARARRDSLGYLPGVAARMFRAGASAILDSLYKVESMSDRDRQTAFVKIVFDNLTKTSILLHERRHIADARAGRSMATVAAELRAKIDEVAGAAYPRLALTAILSPNIGDASNHGQANRRVMAGLARWIRANGKSIAAYDVTMPALLQLPNLTDAQLRAAFAAMRTP